MIERKPMGFGRLPIAVLLGSFATWAAVAAGLDGRTAPKTSGGSAVISGALVEAIGASCRLTLTESNILRNAESGMSFPITVARAAGGRILLVEVENMGVIRVYEASGTLQALLHLEEGRTWGAVILMHPWLADSTAVWDVGKDSLYVFPPELTRHGARPST